MRLTAGDLYELGVVEKVFPEPDSYTKETMNGPVHFLEKEMAKFLETYLSLSAEELLEHRYSRFRKI